jgi:type IV pilus assembly protein PilF
MPAILARSTKFGPCTLSRPPLSVYHLLIGLMVLGALLSCVPQQGASPGKVAKTIHAHYRMGINYLNEGKSPQAIKELLTAQSLATNNADVEHALGLAFQQKGLYDKAVEQYQKALKIDPKLTEARNNMGTAFLALSKYDKAIEQFEICMKDPGYSTP